MLFRTLHAEKDLFFMDNNQPIAALFDLDGVIVDTESQYTLFWRRQGEAYRPDMPHFEQRIKGMTLTQILEFFADQPGIPERIQEELNQFETRMDYTYIPGATDFIRALRTQDIRTAVVTSSNTKKMENVYRAIRNSRPCLTASLPQKISNIPSPTRTVTCSEPACSALCPNVASFSKTRSTDCWQADVPE